nr:PilZ domain-containing protein [Parafrankia sp. BMG5.11]
MVVVHDISTGGILVEAAPGVLSQGDCFEVNLPEKGDVGAQVVWQSGRFSGCKFAEAVQSGVVSAALLRAEPTQTSSGNATAIAGRTDFEPEINLSAALVLSVLLWFTLAAIFYLAAS